MDLAWENAPRNVAAVSAWLAATRPEPGALVVLPEMFSSGFSMNPAAAAQAPRGPTETTLSALAAEYRIWLLAGLAVHGVPRSTNEAVVWNPEGEQVVRYQKQRPFTPGGERDRYGSGSEPKVFTWAGMKVSPFICYDLRFPELFRVASSRWQPEMFVVIASWPDRRAQHWVKLLQARAIEGQAYVVGVNRIGRDPLHAYPGRSMIVDPLGEIVVDAGDAAGSVDAVIQVDLIRDYRTKLPFLADQ